MLSLGLAVGCGAGADENMRGGGVSPSRAGVGAVAPSAGRAAGAAGRSVPPPDFGSRPGVVPQVDPSSVPLGGDGCLNATVLFVVDGSGSMNEEFGSATRWTALRAALLDPATGFIPRFQNDAQFGMLIYDGSIDPRGGSDSGGMCGGSTPANAMCPRLIEVPPKPANMAAIASMFPAMELGGSTPTHRAMNVAVERMIASAAGKDLASSPHFIILATDGAPNDLCVGGGGDGSAQQACVVAAVDRAAMANITTFVISLAGQDMKLEQHLAEVAKHGNPKDPQAHTFSPMTPDDLVMTLRTVLRSALGCII